MDCNPDEVVEGHFVHHMTSSVVETEQRRQPVTESAFPMAKGSLVGTMARVELQVHGWWLREISRSVAREA